VQNYAPLFGVLELQKNKLSRLAYLLSRLLRSVKRRFLRYAPFDAPYSQNNTRRSPGEYAFSRDPALTTIADSTGLCRS